ncbi:hypothetical protein L2E82_14295 [Cichorium intybus]|uniref:Uncharacterized protein n=1 Tax=Cichorium intybus TaxID=13427 RepID=A0ACB9EYX7_CICIN|nr:hypothetical protein L2E82_14295 [Cichorium intybus]
MSSVLKVPYGCDFTSVPVGRATVGRIINVIKEPFDQRGDIRICCLGSLVTETWNLEHEWKLEMLES